MKKLSLATFSLLLLTNITFSQIGPECQAIGIVEPVNLTTRIPQGEIFPGDAFCLELGVENFTSVIGFQFTFSFDPTCLEFVLFNQIQGKLTGTLSHNPNLADQGLLSIIWANANNEGQTLLDHTGIANICFNAIGDPQASEICISKNIQGVTPSTEISYKIDEFTTCSDTLLLIDGNTDCSSVDIQCSELSIIDLAVCDNAPVRGSTNGGISFAVCGGTPPYDFNLSGVTTGTTVPFNTEGYVNLPTGTYTLEVTDSGGSVITETINIDTSKDLLDFEFEVIPPSCDDSLNGLLNIFNTNGGTGPYVVSGINGLVHQNLSTTDIVSFERLKNGTYDITLVDARGCELTKSIDVIAPPLVIDFDVVPASCIGATDGMLTINVSGGTPFPGGQYSFGNILLDFYETDQPFLDQYYNNLDNIFRIEIEDANGCFEIFELEIPVEEVIIEGDRALCSNDFVDITFTVSNAINTDTYTWNIAGTGAVITDQSPNGDMTSLDLTNFDFTQSILVDAVTECGNSQTMLNLSIVGPLETPIISCGNITGSSLEFVWDAINGATGYDIFIGTPSNPAGTMIEVDNSVLSHEETGLSLGQEVTITVTAKGPPPCGDSDVSTTNCTLTTSTTQIEIDNNISLIPNPNSGTFDVNFNGNVNDIIMSEIYNYSGNKVDFEMIPNGNKLSFNSISIPPGLYILKLYDNETAKSIKFIISK
ncbi:T9SS type A sorting domain-containing protein [Saprospiraceae bacterium]|nr:T9SS type A sorting domain-containing protein [Saprospiraceae bacterium]